MAAPALEDVTVFQAFPGRVEALESVDIRARVPGYLEETGFEDGQRVSKDDILFRIEREPYEAALSGAKAGLAQAEAGLNLAEAALQRKQKAFQNQAVSELDILTAEADVQAAEAAVEAAKAQVEQAQINLSYTEITAPMNGRISQAFVDPGNLVGGGQATLLARLINDDDVHVSFNVDERTLLDNLRDKVIRGQPKPEPPPVNLELANGDTYEAVGTVDYFDNTLNPDTGTLLVRARFANPDTMLVEGMFCRVMVPREIEGALLVPELAVQRDLVGPYLLSVDGEGKVKRLAVELGPRVDTRRVITEGVDENARIVVNGIQRARPGIKVTPVTGEGI